MRFHLLLATALTSGLLPSALTAQAPNPAATRAAIARLDFMVGRWTGDAWQLRGNERVATTMVEVVQPQLDGAVLLVEGRGMAKDSTGAERVVHHALGVISFDVTTGAYTLRSYLTTGQSGDFALTPMENGVQWSRAVPGGQVRNTARFTAQEWHEIGEFSRDGTTWQTVMEIRLRKQ